MEKSKEEQRIKKLEEHIASMKKTAKAKGKLSDQYYKMWKESDRLMNQGYAKVLQKEEEIVRLKKEVNSLLEKKAPIGLAEKIGSEISSLFWWEGSIELFIKELNLVLPSLENSVGVGDICHFSSFVESVNKIVVESHEKLEEDNHNLKKEIEALLKTEKAPEGDQTNPEASVQLSNSKEPFNITKI